MGPCRRRARRAVVAARPRRRQRPAPAALERYGATHRRRWRRGRRGRPPRPAGGAQLAGVRPRRGGLSPTGAGVPRCVQGLRRVLRRQGVPLHDRRALGPGGGAQPRRLLVRRADRRPARRRRPEPDRLPRQQQDVPRAAPCGARGRGADRRGLVPRDRAAGGDRRRADGTRLDQRERDDPRHRRRRGAHPRVHRHRARGPEVRLLDHQRRRVAGRAAWSRPPTGSNLLGLHSHIGSPDLRQLRLRGRGPTGARAPGPHQRGARRHPARARPRRRLRHRVHHPGRPRATPRSSPPR